ncbi:MAG: PIN domain nuclease [Methanobacterium sp.]|nr:PIN domain nuclease [Methanobacterium sp.]
MKLVRDTNVFNSRKFCNWLLETPEEKYLHAVAYMEYLYHNLKKGLTQSMTDAFLEQMNISVVPFGQSDAIEAAHSAIGNWDFAEDARDYAIGATAITLTGKLVTYNVKHFKWIENVVTPDEVINNKRVRPE